MNIKPSTYYKEYDKILGCYYIIYTGTKWVYDIASKIKNEPLSKYSEKFVYGTIEEWQRHIERDNNIKVEELSKEDLFLELL